MATELATAYISLVPSARGLKGNIERELGGAGTAAAATTEGAFRRSANRAGAAFRTSMKAAAVASAAAIGGAFAIGKASIDEASNLDEARTRIDAVFGPEGQRQVDQWAAKAANAFGQSKLQATDAIGVYGNLLTSFGIGKADALDMSQTLTGLASDLASFNNTSVDDAIQALRSGLTGETEPLKRYGVALDDASLKAKALALGIYQGTGNLTPAMRAQAAYALVLDRTSNAQGDFERTSDGLANQQRIFAARWSNLKATIGKGLLPVLNRLMPVVGRLFDSIEPFAKRVGPKVQAVFAELGVWWDRNGPGITETAKALFEGFVAGAQAVIGAVRRHWPEIQRIISQAVRTIRTVIESVVSVIRTLWANFGDNILSAVRRVWPRVQQVIKGALDVIQGAFRIFAAIFRGDWGEVWDGAKQVVSGAWEAIQGVIGGAIEAVRLALSIGLETIGGVFSGAWEKIKETARNAVEEVFGFFAGLPHRLLGLGQAFLSAAADIGRRIVEGLASGFKSVVDGAANIMLAIYEMFARVWDQVADWLEKGIQIGIDALDYTLGPTINFSDTAAEGLLPRLMAKGGMVTSPTFAMVGEAGPEVVIPLSDPRRAASLVAQSGLLDLIAGGSRTTATAAPASGSGVSFYGPVTFGSDMRSATRDLELFSRRRARRILTGAPTG